MKVKIVKCSEPQFWYKNHIGEVFEVEGYDATNYDIINNPKYSTHLLVKVDCQPQKESTHDE